MGKRLNYLYDLECVFKIRVNVHELMPDYLVKVLYETYIESEEEDFSDTMHLNLFANYLSYISNVEGCLKNTLAKTAIASLIQRQL